MPRWPPPADFSCGTLAIDAREVLAGRSDQPLAHGDRVFVRAISGYRQGGEVQLEGDVARPGGYPVANAGTRLTAVIAAAGGLSPFAHKDRIFVMRGVGQTQQRVRFKYESVVGAVGAAATFRVQGGDVVVVE